jgi:WSC domain
MLPSFVNEQVDGVLPSLPGCNPITNGPEEASPAPCSQTPISSAPLYYIPDLTTTEHWKYIGCGSDSVSSRTFQGKSESNGQVTVENCIDFCSSNGFTYAGLEYSNQ